MKYKLTPTEKGIEKGKVELEFSSEKQAYFAMTVSPGCYQLEEVGE